MNIQLANKQRGFTLLEALVAFLIISVGMLGIASLQIISLKAGHTAAIRTVAVMKAEEILERMRANSTVLLSYAVGVGGMGTNVGCNDFGAVKLCTPAELAQDDIFFWKDSLKDALPATGTTASVAYITPVPGVQPLALVTVTINWQERDPESTALLNLNYSTSLQMACDSTTAVSAC